MPYIQRCYLLGGELSMGNITRLGKYHCSNVLLPKGILVPTDNAEFSIWLKSHKLECTENYKGSLNALEMESRNFIEAIIE
ncbi:hypothetical protein AVEN_45710-1 [Araneus ventricosus]|uniref:Uncharacterized protein n=1 Tax=Araneus ventricosus TaxID=182803 RepID=A0A4Y2NQK2_ARAVE|nr:hypothetical protein AVEN_45710-1 [Araneus ventricosus]